jgi:hypothetical protein
MPMDDIGRVMDACGIIVGTGIDGAFAHFGTAWSLGGGDWVAAWPDEVPPRDPRLLCLADGAAHDITGWECEDGVAGFASLAAVGSLALAKDAVLHKRDPLSALGFPSVVDHPAFRLHHGSLDAERYLPYVCPWVIAGHLALFSSQDGWIAGQFYPGMAGGPVLDPAGAVVGLLLDGAGGGGHPPLTRFRRLD